MLSASEILDRRKARHQLQLKKLALEELVERSVCEKVYDRIWHHRSTDDEERDQKLRSRIAALSLVGIGLRELLGGAEDVPEDVRKTAVEEQGKIREMLSGVRDSVTAMTSEYYPLAKLQHLSAAHQSLVETLSQIFPATSSADEILPTLIYALITSSPETVNVISDLKFIQRFRASSKVDGEAAYCLVNLEAAVSFVETVDLSSLRSDETPSGPSKSSAAGSSSPPSTPRAGKPPPLELGIAPASDPGVSLGVKAPPSPAKGERRLSQLMRSSANRLETASDSLRDAVLDSADQAFDTINATLNNSFRFLFGRLQEHQQSAGIADVNSPVLPKTLEDARKLVSTPSPALVTAPPDDDSSIASADVNGTSTTDELHPNPGREKMLELIGGRRPARDRSTDSHGSQTSSIGSSSAKRVNFANKTSGGSGSSATNALGISATSAPATPMPATPTPAAAAAADYGAGAYTQAQHAAAAAAGATADGLRSLGNAINPLNQFARMGGLFGRVSAGSGAATPVSAPATTATAAATAPVVSEKDGGAAPLPLPVGEAVRSAADARTLAAVEELKRMKAPTERFVRLKDAKELRVGEVEDLLKEYQALWKAVGKVVGT